MEEPKIGDIYKHFKGNNYKIIAIARDSDTLEKLVVYQGLYSNEEFGDNPIWTRPLENFLETISRKGKEIKRFSLLDI